MSDEQFYIGTLARRSRLTRDAIRYYEEIGVMPEPRRTGSGYRLYGAADVERLGFVRQAQTLGLRLEEIAEVLSMVEEGREPCIHVRECLATRLDETRARLGELRRLENRLQEALGRAEEMLTGPDGGPCRCRIIEDARPERTGNGAGEAMPLRSAESEHTEPRPENRWISG